MKLFSFFVVIFIASCASKKEALQDTVVSCTKHSCEYMGAYKICFKDSTGTCLLYLDSVNFHDKNDNLYDPKKVNLCIKYLENKTELKHTGWDSYVQGEVMLNLNRFDLKRWLKWCKENSI